MTLEQYYSDNFEKWVRFTTFRAPNRQEAEDIVQQLFTELVAAPEKCKDLLREKRMDQYMVKYCILRAWDVWKLARIQRTKCTSNENDWVNEPYERTPETDCSHTDAINYLHHVIQTFSPETQALLQRHIFDEEPIDKIKKQMKRDHKTLQKWEIDAITVLRRFFSGESLITKSFSKEEHRKFTLNLMRATHWCKPREKAGLK